MYWESPEKAQSHIQPLEVSPGLLLLMLSSVIREKLDVLQILQVWSAEQVANRLPTNIETGITPVSHPLLCKQKSSVARPRGLNVFNRKLFFGLV